MDAIVIAGGIPEPDDPLYAYTQGKPKAMLDIGGKPMVQRVLDALGGAQGIGHVVLIGLDKESGLTCQKPLFFIPNQIGMIENLIAGINKVLEIDPSATRVLLSTSDVPAITPEMVDWAINTTRDKDVDLCYTIVKREVIEKRYPGSNRTFTRFKDLEVCGGDVHVLHTSVVKMNPEIWQRLIASRKNPIKQAAMLGFDTLLLISLRRLNLEQAIKKVASRLHMTGTAVLSPYAELAMDVDKPHQLEMMRADIAKQANH